jgi:ribonuclease T1
MSRKPRQPQTQRSTISAGILVVALILIAVIQWNNGNLPGFGPTSTTNTPVPTLAATSQAQDIAPAAQPAAQSQAAPTPKVAATNAVPTTQTRHSNLSIVAFTELPPEAQHTIQLIDNGGPFPYSKDGTIFQNRERLLPQQLRGYYAEYTVPTPGASNRGARRIVTGKDGELYYTDDHYASFREVVR